MLGEICGVDLFEVSDPKGYFIFYMFYKDRLAVFKYLQTTGFQGFTKFFELFVCEGIGEVHSTEFDYRPEHPQLFKFCFYTLNTTLAYH
jgi:hypothetical protein